jgi:hypothetical protein
MEQHFKITYGKDGESRQGLAGTRSRYAPTEPDNLAGPVITPTFHE